jgi:hypothetical protein
VDGTKSWRPSHAPDRKKSSFAAGDDTIIPDVSPGISDPNWWPTPPPPPPPPKIPVSAFVIGGIVCLAVAAGVAFALLDPRAHHSSGPSAPIRSLAAFVSCLKNQNVLIPSAETNDAMLRPAALACRAFVPLPGKSKDPVAAAQAAFEACLENARSKLQSGFGGAGGVGGIGGIGGIASAGNASSSRAAYEQATAVCRAESFDLPGGGGGETPPEPAPTSVA